MRLKNKKPDAIMLKIRIGRLAEGWYKEEDSFEDTPAQVKAAMPNMDWTVDKDNGLNPKQLIYHSLKVMLSLH